MLYHHYAEKMPVIDYHCHIEAKDIAEDVRFENLTRLWLGGDHYKWRLMRANGVEERYITGEASDREKFDKWVETLERAIGNPLYHWCHLELLRYFEYHGILNRNTADEVWELCKEKLKEPGMSARGLISMSHVTHLCTTDDPADTLKWHKILRQDTSFPVQVLPAWRPDAAMNLKNPGFAAYIRKLSGVSGITITNFSDLKKALKQRLAFFSNMGCVVSDHSFDYAMYEPASEQEVEQIFAQALHQETVSYGQEQKYKTALLIFLAGEYKKLGWAMQLHYGVKRDNHKKMQERLGANAGTDCINDYTPSAKLAELLDALEQRDALPKTILYSLNPVDNTAVDTVIGCFQKEECPGFLQHGSAWWFNDNKEGIRSHLKTLAAQGLLGNFIGMLTDSRSFVSYTRHEYFRRILCNLIGQWVENGEYPYEEAWLGGLVCDICYNNAKAYFGFADPKKPLKKEGR